MQVFFSGGGTAGHVVPLLAVVSALQRQVAGRYPPTKNRGSEPPEGNGSASFAAKGRPDGAAESAGTGYAPVDSAQWRYIGEPGGIEETLAARAGIPFSPVETGQIRGQAPCHILRNLARMARGARQCAALLRDYRPDVALITGGYVTVPVAWAAWRAHVPLVIYLPDLTPGLAVRLTARLATRVAVSFPEVARYFGRKAVVTGYPVRPELLQTDKNTARFALGLAADLPVLLVFGGSRGARSINRALLDVLPDLLPRCQVVHISGQLDWPQVSQAAAALPPTLGGRYHAFAYLHDEMVQALAAADLVVARAGASTLGEFPAVGLASILVPYPYAGQHQEANAAYLAERSAALVLEDGRLATDLGPTILGLLDDPVRLAALGCAAAALARPDAALNIAGELERLAGRKGLAGG